MTSLATTITAEGEIPTVGVGVFLQRVAAQAATRGRTALTVGIIGAMPWGTAETWVEPDSMSDLIESFAPFGYAESLTDALGLPWGGLKLWNVRGTTPGAGQVTLDDATTADSLTIIAKYDGADGNRIKYAVTANASVATSRDVRIYVEAPDGTIVHDETYLAVQVSSGAVTDPGDPFVDMEAASGASAPAAAASGTLSGGSNGTIAAADYTAAITAALASDSGIDILVCVGVDTSLITSLRAAIYAMAADIHAAGKVCILPTPAAESRSTAITNIASYRHRALRACYPRVIRSFTYAHRGYSVASTATVDGAATLANIIQKVGPTAAAFQAAAANGAPGATQSIIGLESGYSTITRANADSLMAAGINPWWKSSAYGVYVPFCGVTTYLLSSVPVRDHEERYYQYISSAIGRVAEAFIGNPLDVDLANRRLGSNTAALRASIVAFLQEETAAGRMVAGINADGSSSPAFLFDSFGSATPTNLANGRWDIVVAYRQTPNAELMVIRFNAGTSVNIQSQ